ncbi:MAG: glycosyltransferase [Cyanobacteria bacterium J06554_1]
MKILHVIPSLSPKLGGPTQAVLHLSKNLQNCDVDVQILTTNDNTDQLLDVPLLKPTLYKGVKVTFLPRTLRAKEFIYTHELNKWHQQNLSSFDVIHTHYIFSYLSSWTARAARHRKIPYLMRPLGQLTPWALSQSSLKKKLYRKLLEDKNLQAANLIHCTSPGEADDVSKLGFQTPKLCLPLGVELPKLDRLQARAQLKKQYHLKDAPILLFLSRLHIKKRPELLLKAVQRWKQSNVYVNLLIAGSGEPTYEKQLRDQVKELEINDLVTFTGFVDGKNKECLLQGSDLFMLPSYSENFGIAVAEALAAGTPVAITPDVQTAPWIEKADAGWIIPGQLDSWVRTLEPILQQPHLLTERGLAGRTLAATTFSWPKIAQELLNVYSKIKSQKKLCID